MTATLLLEIGTEEIPISEVDSEDDEPEEPDRPVAVSE